MVNFRRFETEPQAADALYNELARTISNGAAARSDISGVPARRATAPFVVMLAGGSTPMAVYRRLAQEPPATVNPLLHLMLSDDRFVPTDDPRSNRGAIAPLADALNLGSERLVAPDPSMSLDRAVTTWSGSIGALAGRAARFSLGVLGIGADGHTASLFSPAEVPHPAGASAASGHLEVNGHATPFARSTGEHGGTVRITVTAQVILAFERLLFFATGPAKREVLYELSRRPDEYPAGRIMLQHPAAEIWTDVGPVVR